MPWYEHGKPLEGCTVGIIAQGPSVLPEEARLLSDTYPTIAIKDTYCWAPQASMIYACDRSWWYKRWKSDAELREHKAIKVCLDYERLDTGVPNQYWLRKGPAHGFDFREGYVSHGGNSGHQALNLAVNLGAKKIILLGYDMSVIDGKTHCHNKHVAVPHSVFDDFYRTMVSAVYLLKGRVDVINCSFRSRLTCFPKLDLDSAIQWGKS